MYPLACSSHEAALERGGGEHTAKPTGDTRAQNCTLAHEEVKSRKRLHGGRTYAVARARSGPAARNSTMLQERQDAGAERALAVPESLFNRVPLARHLQVVQAL